MLADGIAGPRSPSAPESLASIRVCSPARMAIADAVWERLDDKDLIRSLETALQECWISQSDREDHVARFGDLSWVYGNGEFTFAGFWTVTDPPPEDDHLLSTWELMPGPITRWRLPVRSDIRQFDRRPSIRLGSTSGVVPKDCHDRSSRLGVARSNQDQAEILRPPAQSRANTPSCYALRQVLPDWTAVANDYDGVHSSWGGLDHGGLRQ